MVAKSQIEPIRLVADERKCVLRITAEQRTQLEKQLFHRYPDREWGTFFEFGFRRTSWGLAISFVNGIWPQAEDLDRQSGTTVFRDQYSLRAFRHGSTNACAIGVIHSHPAGCPTSPSWLDDDMDGYFAEELCAYTAGRPYCSLIFQRSEERGFTFSGRVYDRGEWLPVEVLFTIGETVDQDRSELAPACFESAFSDDAELKTARLVALYGAAAARRLRQARIGIIGCSGTGTPATHVLARAGIGEFVLIDPERFSESNLERFHAGFFEDLKEEPKPFKVELLRRLINSINPQARVTAIVGNALHENAVDELLRCDLVLGCTDSVHGRVFLSDVSKQFLLPSIDVGVYMHGSRGRVASQIIGLTQYGPNLPCAFCNGLIDTAALSEELMSEEEVAMRQAAAREADLLRVDRDQYWRSERQLHTVGYLTTTAGAQAAGYAEGLLTGAFSMPHNCFQYDLAHPRLGVVPSAPRSGECACNAYRGWGDQARQYRNVSRPAHWPSRGVVLPTSTG